MEFLPVLFVAILGVAVYLHTNNPHMVQSIRRIATGKSGCLPLDSIDNITFHYFAARGRGEPVRLLLEDAGLTWTEKAFTRESWPAAKQEGLKSGLYTFGQVPALETTAGLQLAQTVAVLKHVARTAGYDCDCDDYTFCDVLMLGVEDQIGKLGRTVYGPDLNGEKRRTYLQEAQPWLAHYEKRAPAGEVPAERGYFTSDGRLTWVDFVIYNMIDVHVAFAEVPMEGDDSPVINILADLPRLRAFYKRFSERPNIAAYLTSPRRHPYSLPKKS